MSDRDAVQALSVFFDENVWKPGGNEKLGDGLPLSRLDLDRQKAARLDPLGRGTDDGSDGVETVLAAVEG